MQNVSHRIALAVLLTLATAVVGCSVALNHDALVSPSHSYTDPIQVGSHAEGINGRVGWGRISLFYIPCVPIHVQGDANAEMMEQISAALQQAGYKVSTVEAPASRTAIVKCKVDKFWFNNYTWLFPFVPTWGDIDVTLSVERAGGQVVWQQSFHGHGWSANFFDGYSSAANKAMTEVLNQIVPAVTSEEFHNALTVTQA